MATNIPRTTSSLASWTITACLVALFAITFAYAPTRHEATADDQLKAMSSVGAHAWAEINCPAQVGDPRKVVRVQADDLLTAAALFDDIRNRQGLLAACNRAMAIDPQKNNANIGASTADQRRSAYHAEIARSY